MGTLLDTSVLIDIERRGLAFPEGEDLAIAAVTAAELFHGAHRGTRAGRTARKAFAARVIARFPAFPFTLTTARVYARIWAEMETRGRTLSANDLQIAATAISLDWSLSTRDRRAFAGIPGLRLVDVQAAGSSVDDGLRSEKDGS